MKKGLLLSVVASTMIFAGGDIAPVEPVVPAPAAECSEFSGMVGLHYHTIDRNSPRDLFDTGISRTFITAMLDYQGEIANGIGMGVQLAALRDMSDATSAIAVAGRSERAELSQLYLSYSVNNTAIKVGRFELDTGLSPLAGTDTKAAMIPEDTFEGILFANADLDDTIIYGAALSAVATIAGPRAATATRIDLSAGDMSGLYALGIQNTSIADMTITAVGYYQPDRDALAGTDISVIAGATTVEFKVDDITLTGQAAFAAEDGTGANGTSTMMAGMISGVLGPVGYDASAWYINNGTAAIGGGVLYSDDLIPDGGFAGGRDQAGLRVEARTAVGPGSLWGRFDYRKFGTTVAGSNTELHARVGYTLPIMKNMKATVQYRYTNLDPTPVGVYNPETSVRANVIYKF